MLVGMSVRRAIIGGDVPPVVSAQANGQANTRIEGVGDCYAGQRFANSGEEFECSPSGNYNQSLGDWLDSGDAADVWVERTVTVGSWNDTDPGAGRLNLATTRSYRVVRTTPGITSVTGYFTFYDAASGGNTLQTTSSATWSAELESDPCPLCCFTPETLITLADGTYVQIVDVRPGDLIKVEGGIEAVGEVLVRTGRPMFALRLEGGRVLRLSADHPVHVEHRGFCCVQPIDEYKDMRFLSNLEIGDRLTMEDGSTAVLEAIEKIRYPDEVYTFSNSRFYANGVLVY